MIKRLLIQNFGKKLQLVSQFESTRLKFHCIIPIYRCEVTMGNRLSFLSFLLFLSSFFIFQNVEARSGTRVTNSLYCPFKSGVMVCMTASRQAGQCVYDRDCTSKNKKAAEQNSSPEKSAQLQCDEKGSPYYWSNNACLDFRNDTQDADGTTPQQCVSNGGHWSPNELPHCCMDPPEKVQACTSAGNKWDFTNHKCLDDKPKAPVACGPNSKPETHENETHCVCTNFEEKNPNYTVYEYNPNKGEANTCSAVPVKKEDLNKSQSASSELSCIQDLTDQINACVDATNEGLDLCNARNEKNNKYTGPLFAITQQVAANAHNKGMQSGAVAQCQTAGVVSSTSKFAFQQMQDSCGAQLNQCKSSCDQIREFTSPQKVYNHCVQKMGHNLDEQTEAKLQSEAQELSSILQAATNKCFGEVSNLQNNLKRGAEDMQQAMIAAATCDCKISGTCPIPQNCLTNPNDPSCKYVDPYPNCIQNPGDARCVCIMNPTNPSCKEVSNMAGGPKMDNGGNSTGISGIAGSGGSKPSSGGGFDGDFGSESAGNPWASLGGKGSGDSSGEAKFNAGSASSGGGGGGGGSAAAKKGKDEPVEEPEKKGIAGMFKTIGNNLKGLFGFGSGNKKSGLSEADKKHQELAALKNKNKYRGVATANKFCVTQANGQEICFGRQNMNIFQMINRGYSKQADSLISGVK